MPILCPTSYDVFCDWLGKQQDLDVVFLQEIHWGCGSSDNRWRIGSWTALTSPDPGNRFAGVGIFVHERVASDDKNRLQSCPSRAPAYMSGAKAHVQIWTF